MPLSKTGSNNSKAAIACPFLNVHAYLWRKKPLSFVSHGGKKHQVINKTDKNFSIEVADDIISHTIGKSPKTINNTYNRIRGLKCKDIRSANSLK